LARTDTPHKALLRNASISEDRVFHFLVRDSTRRTAAVANIAAGTASLEK
jgi:hypothetical protein